MQQFLRGPEKEMTYTRSGTFNGLGHARNFSSKYFASWFSRPRHFSARGQPKGRGRSAYVVITKSTEGRAKDVRAYKEDKAEAATLLAILSNRGGGGSESRSGEGAAAGGSGAGGGSNLGQLSSASGNASSGVARVAAVGNVKAEIDLCVSP